MCMRRTREGRSMYVFFVICRDYVSMLILGGNTGKAYDVFVTCTLGVRKLCMWAGRKHVRKRLFGHKRSVWCHCSDIARGAWGGQSGSKTKCLLKRFRVIRKVFDVYTAFRSWFVICKMVWQAAMCLKGVLGAECQPWFRDMGIVVEKTVILCNINVNLLDLWPEMMFGGSLYVYIELCWRIRLGSEIWFWRKIFRLNLAKNHPNKLVVSI